MEKLVITAVGKDRTGIVNDVSGLIRDAGGNIEDSRMSVLGGEFALMILVSGSARAISKLAASGESMGKQLGLTVVSKRTAPPGDNREQRLSYVVEVIAMDHPGIVHDVADFFSSREINIEDLSTATYRAAHTGTQMFSLNMVVALPARLLLAELRNEFREFCDRLNLDASLEPAGR